MHRRPSRSRSISKLAILLIVVGVIGLVYVLWRYPDTVTEVADALSGDPTAAPAPSPPPQPATPTRTRPTAQPRPRATPAPTAAPAPAGPTAKPDLRTSWYQLFFTAPRYPDSADYHRGGIDTQLVEFLNTATKTIDLAAYDFDLENVAQALARAAGRGVRVRMVTDTDTFTSANQRIQRALAIVKRAKIPIVDDQRPAIMHNKFVVVDGQAVWTGSWNLTDGDTYRLNNHAIRLDVPELANNYALEFDKMFTERQFGPSKPGSQGQPVLQVGKVRIESYFSPQDGVADRVAARLRQAKQSIHFMAFSFTNKTIGKAVSDRAKAGVQVAGVFETTGSETQYSEFGRMRRLKLDVLQDGNPYLMHHKVFIIDGATVIFGSFNFTGNAEEQNDENLLIVDDPRLAQAFEAEFQRVRAVAVNPPKTRQLVAPVDTYTDSLELNP
jgi:phosphatidylserine/phosphatidylglycerophosphate/cardiolipin synthase-like enzyme